MRRCTCCGEYKPYDEFNKNARYKGGLAIYCKVCSRIKDREHYKNNKDKKVARIRKARQENLEKYRQRSRDWYIKNKEIALESIARRKVLLKQQTPTEQTKLEKSMILALYWVAKVLSNSGETLYEVDHIKPISKGGTHDFKNLQILTREENRSKKDKWPWNS